MKIAILGCGYVGSALGKSLIDRHDVVATTTTPRRLEELQALGLKAELIRLAETERLHQLLADRDAVFLTIAPKSRGAEYREVYLQGAGNLLEALPNTVVKRIIYTSSTGVYTQQDGSWVDEHSPTVPTDQRSAVLLETEHLLLEHTRRGLQSTIPCRISNKIDVTVLRLSGIYGPGRDLTERICNASGRERTDQGHYVNLIHRDDIVSALQRLLTVKHHGVLVLSDDQPIKRRELYDRVLADAGLPAIRWLQNDESHKAGKRIRNERIKRLLGLDLKHPAVLPQE